MNHASYICDYVTFLFTARIAYSLTNYNCRVVSIHVNMDQNANPLNLIHATQHLHVHVVEKEDYPKLYVRNEMKGIMHMYVAYKCWNKDLISIYTPIHLPV